MERESKRKAASAASPESEGRASKRQKLPDTDGAGERETPETTLAKGLRFLETMRAAKDKTGRPIATSFLELPDKNVIPQYYDEIKLPIAFSTIEEKLNKRGYTSLAAVESDVKRMVNNAKQFNDKNSSVYADAERVRKTASNFMVKNNPAYKNPQYTAIATPIPGEDANGTPSGATRQLSERPKRTAVMAVAQVDTQPTQPTPSKTRKSNRDSTPRKEPPSGDTDTDFTGKSFQDAQELLVQEFSNYVEPDGLAIYQPFVNLPSRSLKDYYSTIKTPMSLNQVMKKVQGFVGRKEGFSGITDFKTWQQFEECVSLIWRNARDFNEDGSEIFNLSEEFEDHFKRRLEEAKEKVKEPAKQTITLKMGAQQQKPSGIKLRLGGSKNSPAPNSSAPGTPGARSSSTPGVIVDNEALERQQRHVQAGMNGQRPTSSGGPVRNPFGPPSFGFDSTQLPTLSQQITAAARSGSATSPAAANGVKSEAQAGQSPALDSIRPSSAAPESARMGAPGQASYPAAVMPPPSSVTPRPTSGSPYTNGHVPVPHNSYQNMSYHPPNGFDNKHRHPEQNVADALLPNIALHGHPGLNLPRPFKFNIPASSTLTQQSVTLSLPGTHSSIQIMPHVPVALTQRPWRLFVTINNARMTEVYQPAEKREKGRPLFEARLQPGINRIDVEVIAGTTPTPVRGQSSKTQESVEMEKCTVFVNLMRT